MKHQVPYGMYVTQGLSADVVTRANMFFLRNATDCITSSTCDVVRQKTLITWNSRFTRSAYDKATDNKLRFMDLREIASSDSLQPSGTEDRNARENDNCASLFCVTHSRHNIALTWRSASVTGLGLKAHHCFTKRRTAAASTGIALATNRKSMRASLLPSPLTHSS